MIAVLIVTLLILLFLTVPIFAALALSALVVFAVYFPGQGMDLMLAQSMVKSCDSFPLMAIPFFMLVGTLMSKGGLAKKLVDIAEAFTGNSAIGGIMIPAMVKQGYGKEYSASLLAAGSTIGPVIPPSIPMIMFAVTIGCSTTTLFMAGVIPGILMGVGLIVYNKWISKKNNYRGEELSEEKNSKAKTIKEGIWALLMPVIVLGGIYTGVFTPTESAVVGVVYSLIVSRFIYKTLTWQGLKESLVDAAITSATIMILFGGANTFGRILTLGDIPSTIASGILSVTSSKIVIMILINLILLVVGMFIDTNSSVILFAPIVVPLLTQLGYHEIFIGVMMVVNLCIGMLTPPLGPNLFITMRIGGVSLEKTLPSALATIAILYIVLAVMIVFPELVLCLPRLLGMI